MWAGPNITFSEVRPSVSVYDGWLKSNAVLGLAGTAFVEKVLAQGSHHSAVWQSSRFRLPVGSGLGYSAINLRPSGRLILGMSAFRVPPLICGEASPMRSSVQWGRVCVLLCLLGAASLVPGAAHAQSFLKFLAGTAKVAGGVADRLGTAAARRGGAAAALTKTGAMRVTTYAFGAAALDIVVTNIDDLSRLLTSIKGELLITPDVLSRHRAILEAATARYPGKIKLLDDGDEIFPLSVVSRGGMDTLVVNRNDRITFSPEAWSRRGLLKQSIMADLVARMRIVVMASRTDQVQRLAFSERFGNKVRFAENHEQFLDAVSDAKNRFVIVVGHVEGDEFVVYDAAGRVALREEVGAIQKRVADTESVALMMGCGVACTAPSSGPVALIDALQTAEGLAAGVSVKTPMDFLTILSHQAGPLHLDIDLYGNLRSVSASHVPTSDRIAQGVSVSRVFASPNASPPIDPVNATFSFIKFATFFSVMGWLLPLLSFMGPRRVWREIKESYALFLGRGDHDIDNISTTEVFALLFAGPWFWFIFILYAMMGFLFFGLMIVSAVMILPARFLIGQHRIRDPRDDFLIGDQWWPKILAGYRGAAVAGQVGGLAGLYLFLTITGPSLPPDIWTAVPIAIAAIFWGIGCTVALLGAWTMPRLLLGPFVIDFIIKLPVTICFGSVRLIDRLFVILAGMLWKIRELT